MLTVVWLAMLTTQHVLGQFLMSVLTVIIWTEKLKKNNTKVQMHSSFEEHVSVNAPRGIREIVFRETKMVSIYVTFALAECHMSVVYIKHRHLNSVVNIVVLSMFKSVQIHFHSKIHPPHMYLLHNIPTYYIKQSVTVLLFRSHVYIQNYRSVFTITYLTVYPFSHLHTTHILVSQLSG